MKIAKYLFLLILLFTATVSVFVATKDGSYSIKQKKIINVSKDIVYKYVTDKKNWDSINPWKNENFLIKETIPTPPDSIVQKIVLNQVENKLKLELKDTLKNKTVAIWSTSGKQTFKDKLFSIIGRGTKNDFEERFDEALTFINTTLTREINTFDIKIKGFVKKDTLFYIQKPIVSKKEEIPFYIKKYLPQLQQIITSTNTPTNGEPFLIYHDKDTITNKFKYSIAIPLKEKIYTSPDSDIINGQINPTNYVTALVKGNYLHLNDAVQKLNAYIIENKLEKNLSKKIIEVISKNPTNTKSASNWVTEIFIPVNIKKEIIVKPKEKKINNDSITKAIIKDILSADKSKKIN